MLQLLPPGSLVCDVNLFACQVNINSLCLVKLTVHALIIIIIWGVLSLSCLKAHTKQSTDVTNIYFIFKIILYLKQMFKIK